MEEDRLHDAVREEAGRRERALWKSAEDGLDQRLAAGFGLAPPVVGGLGYRSGREQLARLGRREAGDGHPVVGPRVARVAAKRLGVLGLDLGLGDRGAVALAFQ